MQSYCKSADFSLTTSKLTKFLFNLCLFMELYRHLHSVGHLL